MLEALTNQKLLDAWRHGNEQAAQILVRRYMVRLTALARSRLSRAMSRRLEAEDVVLSAWRSFFVAVANSRVVVSEDDDLWPLLVTLTLRKLSRQVTKHFAQRRDASDEVSLDFESSWQSIVSREPSPDEAAMVVDELESLMALLEPVDRAILSRRLQGEDQAAIAKAMNCSERTVRRSLERIRAQFAMLRTEVDEQIGTFTKETAAENGQTGLLTVSPVAPSYSAAHLQPTIDYHDVQLQKLVGQGGFGRVYRAVRVIDGTTVAVKFLKKRFWSDRRCVEWHVVLPNTLCDLAFGFRSGFSQEAVMFGTPFSEAWLKSVGAIGDSVDGDCIEQLTVQAGTKFWVMLSLECDHRLEGF